MKRARNKLHRDRLVSFGVSFGLHSLLLLVLSLIAISTAVVEGSHLLDGTPAAAEDESSVATEMNPLVDPQLIELAMEQQPIEFDLTSLEATAPELAVVKPASPTVTVTEESAPAKAKPARTRGGTATVSDLDTMQAMAASGIQSRVSKAGGKKGEVQFALAWKNYNDLDLHVIVPSGERISHQHRKSQCGGVLDVDMNVIPESDEPVENVRWLRNAPWGRYTILVNYFKLHTDGVRQPQRQSPYQLLAELGNERELRDETAGFGGQQVTVWRFYYVPSTFSSVERERMLKQLETLQAREESQASSKLEQAREEKGNARQRLLQNIAQLYPHTDAAIEALQLMDGEVVKRPNR